MKEFFLDLLLMIQFLTRLPVKRSLPCDAKNFRDGSAMLPIVGLIIGLIQWVVYYFCIKIFPINITTIFVLVVGILTMGCLHQDGFGDIFDGFFSFKGGKEKILEVMKDSRIGTYAAVALIFDILVKYAALSFIIEKGMPSVLIITPIISRFTLVLLFLIGKNAKEKGTGNLFIGNTTVGHFIVSLNITIIFTYLLVGGRYTIYSMVLALIVTLVFLKLCNSKIGGITGDCLGANNEFVEIAILILFTALLK
ncbi:adenosylcobinamide-GDP ribazoletransferase [Clostridium malenominatum]|uniref:Adenosylcobinamide-GDP ribazoletransferase n=1 Tax=Clostridium malenominatum TaxID=1539 RepID=A0ABN1J7F0_9CLOT